MSPPRHHVIIRHLLAYPPPPPSVIYELPLIGCICVSIAVQGQLKGTIFTLQKLSAFHLSKNNPDGNAATLTRVF